VPLDIFASRTFGAINLATLFLYGALAALFYEMPFAMIQGHGYTALQCALGTLPMIACLVILARFGTALATRIGTRAVLTIGPGIVAGGFVLLALFERNAAYLTSFFPGILCIGLGMGITVAPLTTGVIDAADPRHVGVASGINNAVSRVAGLLAIAALTVLLTFLYNASLDRSLEAMHATSEQRTEAGAQRARLGGARFTDSALAHASNDAFATGFAGVALACAVLAALAALVDATAIDNRALVREPSP
jgi:Na+/melibiose symporter-like transporter